MEEKGRIGREIMIIERDSYGGKRLPIHNKQTIKQVQEKVIVGWNWGHMCNKSWMILKNYGVRGRYRWMERRRNMNSELREGKIIILVLIMIG